MKTLIGTVGLPRSGKSTWARKQGVPVVCPDAIRLALHGHRFAARAEPYVWVHAKLMVRSLFLAGHEVVILDATNTVRKRRDEWKDADWQTHFFVIDTDYETCYGRAQAEGDTVLLPIIERMNQQYEPLCADESEWPAKQSLS